MKIGVYPFSIWGLKCFQYLLFGVSFVVIIFENKKELYIKKNTIYKALKSDNFSLWSTEVSIGLTPNLKRLYKIILENQKFFIEF